MASASRTGKSSPREAETLPIFPTERCSQGTRAGSRRGSGAPRFPGSLGESAPHTRGDLHKGLERAPSRAPGEAQAVAQAADPAAAPPGRGCRALRAVQAAAPPIGGCVPRSVIPAAQAPEPKALGEIAQDPAHLLGQAEAGRAQDSEDAPAERRPRAVQISDPLREHSGPCRLGDCGGYCWS